MTVCCTEITLLTQKPKIPGITVFVQYEDTILVENLWRICYTLENTVNKNIIWEGAQSSLVVKGGGLPLYTRNIKKMIQLSATENNLVELRDYILFGHGTTGEIVVNSKQKNRIEMDENSEYITGARLYFDMKKIAEAGLLVRDGGEIKVKGMLPLEPYLLFAAT